MKRKLQEINQRVCPSRTGVFLRVLSIKVARFGFSRSEGFGNQKDFEQTGRGSGGSFGDFAGNLDTTLIKWWFLQEEEDHRDFCLSV